MLESAEKPRLRLLLDHFALIEDDREPWRVAHPLPEVLLLVVCGTIAAGDDFEDIADWGADNLAFLRRFLPYHDGIPGDRWLRMLMNRIDPELFADCFRSWAAALRPEVPGLVAIDGKTSRGSHDRGNARAALHLVSAFATRERLVLGQQAVAGGSCEQETIPLLLEKLAASGSLDGALVTIDAIACNPKVAKAVIDAGADYLIAVKANQPGLMHEIERFFDDPGNPSPDRCQDIDKGHGRVEERRVAVSTQIDWLKGERRFPGEYRLPDIATIVMVEAETFKNGAATRHRRFYVASRSLTAHQAADAIRRHWAIETSLHWVLDVTFNEDKARSRTGHGPANMAVLRHFAFNLLRSIDDKRSIKLRRKRAARNNQYLQQILQPSPH
jgi:predicted transposase YbfD/YdcC